jgi:hypothetical protein
MAHDRNDPPDMNRDPITGQPGSHPIGTGVGAASGAIAGAAAGAFFGPIGLLVGTALGAIAGGATGNAIAESVDPTPEVDYWRGAYKTRPYARAEYDYDRDYAPAYRYGVESRNQHRDRHWDDSLEADLRSDWDKTRGSSRLEWNDARAAVRDSWDRTDRTYRAYQGTDRYWADRYSGQNYFQKDQSYEDYRPAYRYGTYARSRYAGREWDDRLEQDLASGWDRFKGTSRLSWEKAKLAVRDGWHSVERAMPGDADRDGR